MLKLFWRPSWLIASVSAAVALLAATALGVAQVGDQDEEIHACVVTSSGRVRIVEDAASCRPSEQPLSWRAGTAGGQDSKVFDTGLVDDCLPGVTATGCLTRSLPAGGWLLEYRAVKEQPNGFLIGRNPLLSCELLVDGVSVDSYTSTAAITGETVVLRAAVSAASAVDVEVQCLNHQTPAVSLSLQRLVASSEGEVVAWGP